MVSVVTLSSLVADRVRSRLGAGEHTIDGYHVDTKYDPPHLDSYYIGDGANGVMVLCEPIGYSDLVYIVRQDELVPEPGYGQRVCAVSYCDYEPPGIAVEMRLTQ